jgi:SAM-dependent methyltransferase
MKKLRLKEDIKPYFYIRGNYDVMRCTDHIKFDSIFDVGCGKGGASLYFANQSKKVTAITIGEEFHTFRTEWFKELNIDVEYGDFANYSTEKKFDAVWMSHSLEHTQLPGQFLKNAWSILNDNGWLFVLVPPYNHLLTNGHFSTGWNMGTLMYNLLVSGFNIKSGHFVRYGSNLCAFVQKKPNYHLEPGTYVSIASSAAEWPLPVHHHSSLENIYQINWFDDFKDKLKKEEDVRKKIKAEESCFADLYLNTVLNSDETIKKLNNFKKTHKGKKIVCYGAGLFAKKALMKFDFSGMNIIGFVDNDGRKAGKEFFGFKIYPLSSINKEIKPDIVLMTCVKKMWSLHHTIPNEVKQGIRDVVIDHKVFSLT